MEDRPFSLVIIAIIVVVVLFVVGLGLSQFLVDWNRNLVEHSHQYSDSKITQLTENYNSYMELETKAMEYQTRPDVVNQYRAQQKSLMKLMCLAYNQMPNNVRKERVPEYIQEFLTSCN